MTNYFIDSNVILYMLDSNEDKSSISKSILGLFPLVNVQVLVEVVNVARRKFAYSKKECLNLWTDLHKFCEIIPISKSTTLLTTYLVNKHQFQLFDAIIVASALEAGCDTLYSEDLQHKQVVENKLTIINPFI